MRVASHATKISLARRHAGLSRAALAQSIGVSAPSVTLYESGDRNPEGRLVNIAAATGFPVEFFDGIDVPESTPEVVSFRKRQSATKATREKAAASIDLAAGVLGPAVRAHWKGAYPRVDVPDLSDWGAEAAADLLRAHWNLTDGPLANVVWEMEAHGIEVFWTSDASPALSAYCRWVGDRPVVILNDRSGDGCRSRFDAAHELGHLVLHQRSDFEERDTRQMEREADAFASAFLLPRSSFGEDAPDHFDHEELLEMKVEWKASVQAMVRRMRDLRLLSEWQYESAFVKMSAWGWRSEAEPRCGTTESSFVHSRLCAKLMADDRDPKSFSRETSVPWEIVKSYMPVLEAGQRGLSLAEFTSEDFDGLWANASELLPAAD